ncbi:MAG: hypothetical protein ACTSR4_03670 [Candidatus Hodarchaeales archaeon]
MIEAAEQYAKSPGAMELRWINLLFEAATEGAATIMLIPANIPVAGVPTNMPSLSSGGGGGGGTLPPVGVYGIKPLPVAEKEKKEEK